MERRLECGERSHWQTRLASGVLALRGAGAPQLSRVCVLPPTYVSWVGRMQHGVCETLRGLAVRRSARVTLALPPHLSLEPRALLELHLP